MINVLVRIIRYSKRREHHLYKLILLDRFLKNLSFKIAMSEPVGVSLALGIVLGLPV